MRDSPADIDEATEFTREPAGSIASKLIVVIMLMISVIILFMIMVGFRCFKVSKFLD